MAKNDKAGGDGEGRFLVATLVYGKRYRCFGKMFLKDVPQEITADEADQLKTLKAIPPGRDIPVELLHAILRFQIARTSKRPAPPSSDTPTHRGTSSTQDLPMRHTA